MSGGGGEVVSGCYEKGRTVTGRYTFIDRVKHEKGTN
jgi:hypothetical protein